MVAPHVDEHVPCARHAAKCFRCIIPSDAHNHHQRSSTINPIVRQGTLKFREKDLAQVLNAGVGPCVLALSAGLPLWVPEPLWGSFQRTRLLGCEEKKIPVPIPSLCSCLR